MKRTTPPNASRSSSHSSRQKLWCSTCGYELTGLAENRCPECGDTFDRTILADDLKYAGHDGRRLVLYSLLVPVSSILLNGGCLIVFSAGSWDAIGWLMVFLILEGVAAFVTAVTLAPKYVSNIVIRSQGRLSARHDRVLTYLSGLASFVAQIAAIIGATLFIGSLVSVPGGP